MRFNFFFILSALFIASCSSSLKFTKDGTKAYEQKKFAIAATLLPKEIAKTKKEEDKITKFEMLAKSYHFMNKPEQEAESYQELVSITNTPLYYYNLALAQKRNEQYKEAMESLITYKELSFDALRSNPHIEMCKKALSYNDSSSNISIFNLEGINTSASEFSPVMFKNKLLFSSAQTECKGEEINPWTGEKFPDIFIAKGDKVDNWSAPESFDEVINTTASEGSICFNKNFTKAYFTRCHIEKKGNSYCAIYESEADGDFWNEAHKIQIFSDTVNVGQPFLNASNTRLYFSSDAPFGMGGHDIYYLEKRDTIWSDPINAGYYVNTDKDELFPFVDRDEHLFFSSNGKIGYGGLDIFKATANNKAFEQVEHLPFPINTGADDFGGFILLQSDEYTHGAILESAYFASSRKGGKGNDDIYLYEKRFVNFYKLLIQVVELNKFGEANEPKKPIKSAIVLFNGVEYKTDSLGKISIDLEANSDYKFLVSKKEYFNQSARVSTKGLSSVDSLTISLFKEIALEKIEEEHEIVIKNIYYDYDKASLRPESYPILENLLSFFNENADLSFEIGSHTDSRGSDEYNMDLSQRRAQSVVDYFIQNGVPSSQIIAKGYGESKLVNNCSNGASCSEEEHQKNRRTTFKVISSSGKVEESSE